MIKLPRHGELLHERIVKDLEVVLNEGFKAVDPLASVIETIHVKDDVVIAGGERFRPRRIHVIGFGKASVRMLQGVERVLAGRIYGGVVISPEPVKTQSNVIVVKGDHPYPRENTLSASKLLIDYLLRNVEEEDLVLALISGGGSALFEIPEENLELEDIAETTRKLMLAGADIYELNTVRKHLSAVKGGKLAKYIKGKVVALVVSDVVGDDPSTIASGPLSPDTSTFKDVHRVLTKYGILREIPERVRSFVERGLIGLVKETLKPGDPRLNKVYYLVIANNTKALKEMEKKARELGYNAISLTPYLSGEAREAGKVLAGVLKSIKRLDKPVSKPAVVIAGGETTVTVRGKGVGGRNQELCLSITIEIKSHEEITVVCIGSDGIDGNSPAAGAITSGRVYGYAVKKGLIPEDYLAGNNSYIFFNNLGLAIHTGYTGTNVGDLFIAVIA